MSCIWLNVEISPGTHIKDACQEASDLANKLDVDVWFDFNEVKMLLRPGDNPQNAALEYGKELCSEHSIKIASDKRGHRCLTNALR